MFVSSRDARKRQRKIPVYCIPFFALGFLTVIVHLCCRLFPSFAEGVNQYPANWLRIALSALTGWFPFSLAEILVVAVPLLVATVIFFAIRCGKSNRMMIRFICVLLAVISFLYFIFVFTLGCGYSAPDLGTRLGWKEESVSLDELSRTAQILAEETEKNVPDAIGSGGSRMPYSREELNLRLLQAYEKAAKDYSFLPVFDSAVKPVLLSKPMTYTNITGVYFFLTGEANLNVNYPDYTLPFTMAHELAHQRGIAREDEANFIAFLVCGYADDSYIRYSGYMNMLEYVLNALYDADPGRYREIVRCLSDGVKNEMQAYAVFYREYRNETVSSVSNAINDGYLKINGTPGSVSYGLVVDLAVAYYRIMEQE